MPPREKKIEVNPLVVGGVIVAAVVAILLVVSLVQIFRKNPYGPETRIDNIDIVDKSLPRDQKEQIFANLYLVLSTTLDGEEPPKNGALVREGTVDYRYNSETDIYSGSFVVDIEPVQLSYKVILEWSPKKNNTDLSGYPILITCVPESLQIYEGQQKCVNFVERVLSWDNAYQLDYTFGATTSYRMREALGKILARDNEDTEDFTVTVDEVSLTKLRDQPGVTYQYDVAFGGGIYKITTRVDETYGRDYIAVYISGGRKKQQGLILTDKEELREELSAWLRSFSGKADLEITTERLSQD